MSSFSTSVLTIVSSEGLSLKATLTLSELGHRVVSEVKLCESGPLARFSGCALGKLSSSDSTASAADISLAVLERLLYVCRGFGGFRFRRICSICSIKYKAKVKTYC